MTADSGSPRGARPQLEEVDRTYEPASSNLTSPQARPLHRANPASPSHFHHCPLLPVPAHLTTTQHHSLLTHSLPPVRPSQSWSQSQPWFGSRPHPHPRPPPSSTFHPSSPPAQVPSPKSPTNGRHTQPASPAGLYHLSVAFITYHLPTYALTYIPSFCCCGMTTLLPL